MAEKEDLDRLAREQERLGMQIVQQLSNCKKDSVDRRTEAYVQKHLTNLDAILQTIQKNEAAMIKIKGYSEHQYFTKQYAQQLYAKFDELKTYLLTCPKAKPTTIQSEPSIASIQEKRIKTQNFKIQQLEDTLAQIRSELTLEKSEFRYKHLMESSKKQWDAIQNLHEEIAVSEDSHQDKYFTMDVYKQIQSQFDEAIEALAAKIQQNVVIPPQQILVNQPQQNLQLPKVQIPIFHGGYENWSSFFDIFRRVIHENSALNKADKMHYLKTNTRGEASKLIQHLEAIAANYDSAWDLLQKRYENKRLLIFKLLDKLIDLPDVPRENAEKLKQLHDVTSECLQALKNLDVKVDTWGPIVIRMTMRKWDSETSRLYEQSLEKPHDVPELEEFMKFLERRFQSLETIPGSERKPSSEKKYINSSCLFCQDQHMTYHCQKFKEISAQERNRYVQEKRICYNCLSHDINKRCFSHAKCSICSRQHHTLLHIERQQNSNRQPNHEERPTTSHPRNTQRYPPRRAEHYPPRGAMSNHASRNEENVLLATALVEVSTSSSPQVLRILIDQGSQISIITEEAAIRLGLPRHSIRAQISGIGDGEPKVSKWSIDAQIKPRFMSTFSMDVNMIVLPKLTQSMPKRHLHINSIDSWKNEVLADPTFMTPGAIDGILGAKEYANIILNGMQKTTEGLLKQNTELGWIVSGPIASGSPAIQVVSMITHYEEDRQLTKFWEIEEITQAQQLTEEEQACEEIFEETTTRDTEGRFIVRIPFKQSADVLGHSKPRAAARFKNIERKLHQDPSLQEQYSAFMKEYIELDHMRKVTRHEVNQGKYYIPHQAVIREASTTTRLRVVFDASCKSSTNISLNDIMHVGPRLQQNIADILLRWRMHEIVFCADIEKMYRQIRIHPDDQQFQRILWREHPQQPMYEYELTTVTYGTASAPYLAIKTLQKLAIEESTKFPAASQAALRDFYVDDILSGAADTESALELQSQLLKMLSLAGFNLRKWSSNAPALLQSIPEQFREQKIQELPQEDFKKSLGVLWSPADDTFKFQVEVAEIRELTKRQILSEISKLFDPLGWLSPIIIQAKLIIQDLWLRNLSWDEPVDQEISSRWIQFQSKIKEVEKIKIPRWIHLRKTKIELHGFCDASEKAYGAVIYSRIEEGDKLIITLLQAKSKVAPAKNRSTLPRLELCAAVLLSKLIQKTKTALQMGDTQTFAWTDSMITLAWIKGDSTRWKTFVANRVCEIHRNAPQASWNHVKSQENPADIISRGLDPDKLQSADLWWKGPHWLTFLREIPTTDNIPDIQEEVKATCHKIEVTIRSDIWERFSNLTRMLRVLSYCRRFIKKEESLTLSVQEVQDTFEIIIKIVQQQEFSEEYKSLQQQNALDKKSKLQTLNPFLDSKGIIRVGGRLEHSPLSYDQRHPMILPYHSHISTLVVRNAHKTTLHGGNQATLSYIRSRFWIINGKRAVKAVINKCIVCIRHKAETAQQLMGQLPKSRVTPAPPFTNSGVDYAGPIQVRATKGRGHKSYKGYIAVFVCLATKAIHLEVVSDMTTEAFLAALRRFTARRGHCANMYSDNGTTFVGAARLFEDEITKLIQSQSVQNTIVNLGTQWHFIPPAAPHFGGIWEAGVKSMKHHLKRVIGDCTLTYEELTTLVYQIEACLNSRPLYPLTEDTDDFNILTPGHFLIGRELLAPPNLESTEHFNLSQRWRHVQKLKKNIWSAWCTEYLTRLQQRYKWKNQTDNLRVGTMVLIKEENINPNQWPLGRIIKTHQGQDGAIRVVTIKKAGGSPQ